MTPYVRPRNVIDAIGTGQFGTPAGAGRIGCGSATSQWDPCQPGCAGVEEAAASESVSPVGCHAHASRIKRNVGTGTLQRTAALPPARPHTHATFCAPTSE